MKKGFFVGDFIAAIKQQNHELLELVLISNDYSDERHEWYEQAAPTIKEECEASNPIAIYLLGYMHLRGYQVDKDKYEAIYNYRKALDLGYKRSLYDLSVIFREGIIVKKDLDKAYTYAKMGTKQKLVACLYELGKLYNNEDFSKYDRVKATKYYAMSADLGFRLACLDYGKQLLEDPEQNELGIQYLEKAKNLGLADACYYLGTLYADGKKVKRDLLKAFELYNLAGPQGKKGIDKLKQQADFIDELAAAYASQKEYITILEGENNELRLRPPHLGGPDYEAAKYCFENYK